MTIWVQEYATNFANLGLTEAPGLGSINGLDSGWNEYYSNPPPSTTPRNGTIWWTQAGAITGVPVTAAGSYTVAPNVTISGYNGASTANSKQNATATANLTGTALTSIAMVLVGLNYQSSGTPTLAASLSGGTGSGGAVGTPTLTGNLLRATTGPTGIDYGYASQGYLCRPAPQITQRVVVTGYVNGGGALLPAAARINLSTNQLYGAYIIQSGTNLSLGLTYWNNQSASGGSKVQLAGNVDSGIPVVPGHQISLDLQCVGSSPTQITCVITDITAGLSWTSPTYSDNSAGVQAAGYIGTAVTSSQLIQQLVTYQPTGFSTSPVQSVLNQNNLTVTLTPINVATPWTAGSTSTFSITNTGSPPTQATLVSQVVNAGGTTATLVINTGGVAGTLNITDTVNNNTEPFALVSILAPGATIQNTSLGAGSVVVGATTYAVQGTPPYTYQLYSSPNSNFAYNDGSATLRANIPALGTGVTPSPQTVAALPGALYFFAWVVIDATGETVQGFQAFVRVPSYTSPSQKMGFIGDSLTVGHSCTYLIQQLVAPAITARGSGQTPGTYPLTITNGLGYGAVGYAVVGSTGQLNYGYFTNGGFAYTNENVTPTFTYSGAGGTPGTLSTITGAAGIGPAQGATGGGFTLALQRIMQQLYGFTNFQCVNAAHGGSAAVGWQPTSVAYPESVTGYMMEAALSAFGPPSACPVIHLMLGGNDSGNYTPSQYAFYMNNILAYLTGLGYKVMLSHPTFQAVNLNTVNISVNQSPATLLRMQQYQAQIDLLLAAYPGQVYQGWTYDDVNQICNAVEMFAITGGGHWSDAGYSYMGAVLASRVAALYQLLPPPSPVYVANTGQIINVLPGSKVGIAI